MQLKAGTRVKSVTCATEVMVVLISASGKPLRLTTALREALQAS